jgi:hypothetical protein
MSKRRLEDTDGVGPTIVDMNPQAESSTQEVLAGLVERVTYHNAENGFCVLRAKAYRRLRAVGPASPR